MVVSVQPFEFCVQKRSVSCTQIEESLTMTTEKFKNTSGKDFIRVFQKISK